MTTIAIAAEESVSPLFPIVGIGASAGGLEAISELIAELSADSGMAFLVVQHLGPTQPSMLPEILANRTSIPVLEAVEGMIVEMDRLYVIPPNTSMSIVDEHIKLRLRDDASGLPTPIDDLLDSLAKDRARVPSA